MSDKDSFTVETLFDGRLQCFQGRKGYRFTNDSVLLAHFIKLHKNIRVLDLGAGCGIVSLILSHRYPGLQITGLELQVPLFSLYQKNIKTNGLQERIKAVHGDLRSITQIIPAASFNCVLVNPPFYKLDSGRQSDTSEQALAKHELNATCRDIVRAVFYVLQNGGRAGFVYPVSRLPELLFELKQKGLESKRLQVVYGYPGGVAKTCLLEAHKSGGEGFEVLPPLYVYGSKGGEYSPEMADLYRP